MDRVYKNDGNAPLLALLDTGVRRVFDVGCGAGDNAFIIKSRFPDCEIHGITRSATEAAISREIMNSCWVGDIEGELPAQLRSIKFDAIIFSHVLEHLRDPGSVVDKFADLLDEGGAALIAVPNVLSLPMRWQFLRGDFEYRSEGVLDDTHLRFFTYRTADRYLLARTEKLRVVSKCVAGGVPQWFLRRHILPRAGSDLIDRTGCRLWPNLFGHQVLIKALRVCADVRR